LSFERGLRFQHGGEDFYHFVEAGDECAFVRTTALAESRYTHRVAISNSRLVAVDDEGITFKYKDYRIKGRERYKTMTLRTNEFIRRFLIHVLPHGFHRIRHYGLLANGGRAKNIARARELLDVPKPALDVPETAEGQDNEPPTLACPCPKCGGRMIIIETFERGGAPRNWPPPEGIDSS